MNLHVHTNLGEVVFQKEGEFTKVGRAKQTALDDSITDQGQGGDTLLQKRNT